MKICLKEIFLVQTNERKYAPTIMSYILVLFCLAFLIIISNYIPIKLLSRFIMVCLTALAFYITIAFFSKIIFISENKEKQKVKNGIKKFKYESVFVEFENFRKWLINYSAPEQLIIKLDDGYHYIEISYDTKGRRGKYINRKTYFDDVETKILDIEKIIMLNSKDKKIEVFETCDHQNPQLIFDEINDLK